MTEVKVLEELKRLEDYAKSGKLKWEYRAGVMFAIGWLASAHDLLDKYGWVVELSELEEDRSC